MVIEYRSAIGKGAEFDKRDWMNIGDNYPATCKHIAGIFADHHYGAVKITVTDGDGDRWQYRQVPDPTPVAAKELQFRLITQLMASAGREGPWEPRQEYSNPAETLEAIEAVLRAQHSFGIDHLKIIDADGDTWEWRLA